MDAPEENLKKKRIAERQKIMEQKKAEEQLKATLRVVLEDDAYDRITNVQLANQELFLVAAQHILAIYKRIGRKIRDHELLTVLMRLKEGREKRTNITFERK